MFQVGDSDVNEEPLYVGRVNQCGNVVPGKSVCSHGLCYVGYEGREIRYREYQVLTNPNGANLTWAHGKHGNVPLGALVAGKDKDGESLYVGRALHSGSLVTGRVHPSRRFLCFF